MSPGPEIGPESQQSQSQEGRFIGTNKAFYPEKLPNYSESHFCDGKFSNEEGDPNPGPMPEFKFSRIFKLFSGRDCTEPLPARSPTQDFSKDEGIHAWWLSHSTILIQIGTSYIITDPIFDRSASPFGGMINRVTPPPCEISDLPPISFVLISHNHWDHLCERSVREIAHRFPSAHFLAPRGVSQMLEEWGIQPIEFDWRTHLSLNGVDFFCFPARHGSARWLSDRNKTLWCSWVISCDSKLIYFPGDTAIGPHFRAIKEFFGRGMDLMFGPIGPQEPSDLMRTVHTNAEDIRQMSNDIEAKVIVPIHYGTFPLGMRPPESDLANAIRVWAGDDRFVVLDAGGRVDWNGDKFVKGE